MSNVLDLKSILILVLIGLVVLYMKVVLSV